MHPKLVVIIALSSFILGLIIGIPIPSKYAEDILGYSEKHSGQKRLTNKLLDFDIPPSQELGSYKSELEKIINNDIENNKAARISIYFRDLNNGPWIGIRESDKFIPASLLKLPLMMVYFKKAESDPTILKKKYKYNANEYPQNTKMHFNMPTTLENGKEYTTHELIEKMIIYSDNDALKILTSNIDVKEQMDLYNKLGIRVPNTAESEEFMSARSMSAFLRVLYNSTYLNEEMSEKALDILARTEFNAGLTAGVPQNTLVAQKYGERDTGSSKELHDCGIVYYPKHPYILCVMSQGNDYEKLAKIIKEISVFTYNQVKEANN